MAASKRNSNTLRRYTSGVCARVQAARGTEVRIRSSIKGKASQGGKLPAAHLATNLGVDRALVQGVGTNQLLELPACQGLGPLPVEA